MNKIFLSNRYSSQGGPRSDRPWICYLLVSHTGLQLQYLDKIEDGNFKLSINFIDTPWNDPILRLYKKLSFHIGTYKLQKSDLSIHL